jgi:hypothetical protein
LETDPGTEETKMSDSRRLHWGILGCARITRRGLVPGIRAARTGTLHALASRDSNRARAWAEEFGVPRACGSYQEVLDDPTIDAVYIPLPNELHRPWVLAAADAGKQEAAGAGCARGPAHGRALSAARCPPDGSIHVAAPGSDGGNPQDGPRRRDR